MHLDGEIGAFGAGLAGIELGHRELFDIGPALIHVPSGAVGQKPRRIDLQSHLRDHLLHQLQTANRRSECLSLLGESERMIEAGLRQSQRARRQEHARLLIATVKDVPPAMHGSDDVILIDIAVLKIIRTCIGRSPPHFSVALAGAESFGAVGNEK